MLYAPFVAGVQIIVYAGGIMVLFLFVIMLVNIERAHRKSASSIASGRWDRRRRARLLALFVSAYREGQGSVSGSRMPLPEASNTQQIGDMLYGEAGRMGQYTFAFEIASLLLLVAISGRWLWRRRGFELDVAIALAFGS